MSGRDDGPAVQNATIILRREVLPAHVERRAVKHISKRRYAMRHADDIRRFIIERLGFIDDRPMMYGGSAEGVDLIIHNYHELLSFIEGCHERYRAAERDVHAQGPASHQNRV